MNWVSLIILLAVLQSMVFGGLVARARYKYKVEAPAISGNEIFERFFRVHYNSNEQLLVFLPSIWLFGSYLNASWASILGAIYLVGRIVYAMGYVKSPKQRELGFNLSAIPNGLLLLGALYGVIRAIMNHAS